MNGRQDEAISIQLREWKKNFIDVKLIMDDLIISKGKIRTIEAEVNKKIKPHHLHIPLL